MRLVDLNPRWIGAGGEGVTNADGKPAPKRTGVGLICDCPCGCADELVVEFKIALDGKPWRDEAWDRTGHTFETLTTKPSLQRVGGCGWHGFITNGEVTTC